METLATRRPMPTEQAQRWLELWAEYEATKNEVLGVLENTATFGEAHSRALLVMARERRTRLEQALVELSRTTMTDPTRGGPIG